MNGESYRLATSKKEQRRPAQGQSQTIVAYFGILTFLPALLEAVNAPNEPKPLGQPALAPADNFLKRHRVILVARTAILALAGLPSLTKLQFDFNPVHLVRYFSAPF